MIHNQCFKKQCFSKTFPSCITKTYVKSKNVNDPLHPHDEGKCKSATFVIQAVSWRGIDHIEAPNIRLLILRAVKLSFMTHFAQ